ncbi:MAG: hypothetical protein ACREEV_17435 [Dongiaceae bacterium]
MGNHPPRERDRPRLALATDVAATGSTGPASSVAISDLIGLDLTRVPQELAAHVPGRETPWPRGTCLPAVDTPDGRQALCFGTINELRPVSPQWRSGAPVNSARTLWVVTLRD